MSRSVSERLRGSLACSSWRAQLARATLLAVFMSYFPVSSTAKSLSSSPSTSSTRSSSSSIADHVHSRVQRSLSPPESIADRAAHNTVNASFLVCWQLQRIPPTHGHRSHHNSTGSKLADEPVKYRRVIVFNKTLNNHFQEIATPHFPRPYPGNYECSWTFSIPFGHRYRLLVTQAEFEYDSEETDDCEYSATPSSHILVTEISTRPHTVRKLCGRNNTAHQLRGRYSNSPVVHIDFKSHNDTNITAHGFRAVFFSYPRHSVLPISLHVTAKKRLAELEKQKCVKAACSSADDENHNITYYYTAGQVKTLLRKVLRNINDTTNAQGSHPCSEHPMLAVLSHSAKTNSERSPWTSRNRCKRSRRSV